MVKKMIMVALAFSLPSAGRIQRDLEISMPWDETIDYTYCE